MQGFFFEPGNTFTEQLLSFLTTMPIWGEIFLALKRLGMKVFVKNMNGFLPSPPMFFFFPRMKMIDWKSIWYGFQDLVFTSNIIIVCQIYLQIYQTYDMVIVLSGAIHVEALGAYCLQWRPYYSQIRVSIQYLSVLPTTPYHTILYYSIPFPDRNPLSICKSFPNRKPCSASYFSLTCHSWIFCFPVCNYASKILKKKITFQEDKFEFAKKSLFRNKCWSLSLIGWVLPRFLVERLTC